MNKHRPVNLEISTIKLPITAVVSILHRVSGVFLFAGIALLMWLLDTSLDSAEGFAAAREALASPLAKIALWVVLSALAYHLVAGIRHMIMDFGIGETLKGGRLGATLALVIAVILSLLAGVWIW